MVWNDKSKNLKLQLAPGSSAKLVGKKNIQVRLAGTSTVKNVVFDGKPLSVTL
jgi:hypothetical protein